MGSIEVKRVSGKEVKMHDLTGLYFGKLQVIKKAENIIRPSGKQKTAWVCKCECGNEKIIETDRLTRGITKSCGCIKKEAIAKARKNKVKTKIYRPPYKKLYKNLKSQIKNVILERCKNCKACSSPLNKNEYCYLSTIYKIIEESKG